MLKKVYAFFMVIVASLILTGTIQAPLGKQNTIIPSVIQPISKTLPITIKPTLKSQEVTYMGDQVNCLAKNIYFEAATQSTAGKLAVAFVTKNRVQSRHFPNTFCEVVYQGPHWDTGHPKRDRCQFSWYCDGMGDDPREGRAWENSKLTAKWFYDHQDRLMDITDGATHYHAGWMEKFPKWAYKYRKNVRIDDHIFYQATRLTHKKKKTNEITLARL